MWTLSCGFSQLWVAVLNTKIHIHSEALHYSVIIFNFIQRSTKLMWLLLLGSSRQLCIYTHFLSQTFKFNPSYTWQFLPGILMEPNRIETAFFCKTTETWPQVKNIPHNLAFEHLGRKFWWWSKICRRSLRMLSKFSDLTLAATIDAAQNHQL